MLLENLQETEEESAGRYTLRKFRNTSDYRNMTFSPHWHENCEMLYILSGELDVMCGNDHIIGIPGDLIFVPSKALHSGVTGKEGCDYYAVLFKWSSIIEAAPYEKHLVEAIIEGRYSIRTLIRDKNAGKLFEALFSLPKEDSVAYMFSERAAIYSLLAYLFTYHMVEGQRVPETDQKFGVVVQYIDDHFLEPITTDDVAQNFSYSKSYFCRLFKQHMGIPPLEYINYLRIERAQELIKEGKMTLSQVAAQSGFNSLSYFSATFKRYVRKSPNTWKSEFLENDTSQRKNMSGR